MIDLIIKISISVIILVWVLYLNQLIIENKKIKKLIIKNKIFHPNSISITRIFIWLLSIILFHIWLETIAIALFVLSSILDSTDWIIARNCNLTSDLWKSLDPMADKITYVVALIYFAIIWKISTILVIIFIIIDLVGQLSRILLNKLKLEKRANIYWKLKTSFIFLVILLLMLFYAEIPVYSTNLLIIIWIIFAILSIVFKFITVKR